MKSAGKKHIMFSTRVCPSLPKVDEKDLSMLALMITESKRLSKGLQDISLGKVDRVWEIHSREEWPQGFSRSKKLEITPGNLKRLLRGNQCDKMLLRSVGR